MSYTKEQTERKLYMWLRHSENGKGRIEILDKETRWILLSRQRKTSRL